MATWSNKSESRVKTPSGTFLSLGQNYLVKTSVTFSAGPGVKRVKHLAVCAKKYIGFKGVVISIKPVVACDF